MASQKYNLGDKIKTPQGVIEVQSIQYDPKKDEYAYSVLGPKSRFWRDKDCELVERRNKK